eukprot:6352907-Prymnesium_polylepis.2
MAMRIANNMRIRVHNATNDIVVSGLSGDVWEQATQESGSETEGYTSVWIREQRTSRSVRMLPMRDRTELVNLGCTCRRLSCLSSSVRHSVSACVCEQSHTCRDQCDDLGECITASAPAHAPFLGTGDVKPHRRTFAPNSHSDFAQIFADSRRIRE